MADDLTRKMGSDDDEANRVRIPGPSARGIISKLEHRVVADLAEANQVASNPQAQPVEIEQPSNYDQMPQPLTRISLHTKEQMVSDENEIARLQIVGCDSQIRRRVLRTLDTIGSIGAPPPIAYILGTEALWQMYNPQPSKG